MDKRWLNTYIVAFVVKYQTQAIRVAHELLQAQSGLGRPGQDNGITMTLSVQYVELYQVGLGS